MIIVDRQFLSSFIIYHFKLIVAVDEDIMFANIYELVQVHTELKVYLMVLFIDLLQISIYILYEYCNKFPIPTK